ncbi:MAG: hypothetical protein QNJ47_02860 [Nostocaceae cyanobacterium]|nr:hypothetical protein [Nostocaceae cyanobacterium]
MDISKIPLVFWYSLSVSMLSFSTGITLSSLFASTVSVEVANSKINLSKNINDVKMINNELKMKAEQLENIEKAYKELQSKYDKILQSTPSVVVKQELTKLKPEIQQAQSKVNNLEINTKLRQQINENEQKLEQINQNITKISTD